MLLQKKKHFLLICEPFGLEIIVDITIDSIMMSVIGKKLIVGVKLELSVVGFKFVALNCMKVEKERRVDDVVNRLKTVSACAAKHRKRSDRETDE